ncbi:MAG: DegV family protein, partial [Chloroflexota bacterium]
MDSEVTVVTDSSCDLPQELVEEYGIEIVPLNVHF